MTFWVSQNSTHCPSLSLSNTFWVVARETMISWINPIYKTVKNSQTLSSTILILFPMSVSPELSKKKETTLLIDLQFYFCCKHHQENSLKTGSCRVKNNWFLWYINWKIGPAIPENLPILGQLLMDNRHTYTCMWFQETSKFKNVGTWLFS